MFIDWKTTRIFLVTGKTDLRKSWHGLSGIIADKIDHDPYSGHIYLFANKRRNLLKIIYWQTNGFCIWQKKISKQSFPWLYDDSISKEIDLNNLKRLLNGMDIFSQHNEIFPSWQSGIGEFVIENVDGEIRKYQVIGYKEFEKKLDSKKKYDKLWLGRLKKVIYKLDVSKPSTKDFRLIQLKNFHKSICELILEIHNSGLELSPFYKSLINNIGNRLAADN